MDDESIRALLVGTRFEDGADRPYLDPGPAAVISYADAVGLIRDGWADPVEADLDGVEQQVGEWVSGRG